MSRFTELKRLYIDKGLKIFPIVKNGKAPLIEAWQLDCSIDIPQIAYWLEHAKDCNWGMPCSENNIFVLDIDRHGVDGMESLKKLLTDLNNYYKSDAANKLQGEFEAFSKEFPKFVENVETMSNNLKGVIEDKKANDQARADATNI